MAHRHTLQRARGGRNIGGKGNKGYYSGPNTRVLDEARSQDENFKSGGKTVAKAHGGKVKSRGDRFKRGGSVWSHAADGLRGKKGFAGKDTPYPFDGHDELIKSRAGDSEKKDNAKSRMGHKGKAAHQYAKGGAVKLAKGGAADPMDMHPEKEPKGDWQKKHAKGGRIAKAKGGECDDDSDMD